MKNREELRKKIERQVKRMSQVDRDKPTLLAQTVFLGTLALLFILPVAGSVYFGRWIDVQMPDYSYRWTISLLLLGLLVGITNVYLYIRKN